MKLLQLVLIQALLFTSVYCRPPLFRIPILGFTDIDAIDYSEGFASGFFGKDVREQWDSCAMGIPNMMLEFKALIDDLSANFVNPAELFENFGKLQKIVNFFFDMIKNGPKDVKGCQELVTETTDFIAWIVKHVSITTVTTGLLANLVSHIFAIVTDVWSIVTEMFSKDYYSIGKDEGDLFTLLLS